MLAAITRKTFRNLFSQLFLNMFKFSLSRFISHSRNVAVIKFLEGIPLTTISINQFKTSKHPIYKCLMVFVNDFFDSNIALCTMFVLLKQSIFVYELKSFSNWF